MIKTSDKVIQELAEALSQCDEEFIEEIANKVLTRKVKYIGYGTFEQENKESNTLKAGCPVCLQEVDTYTDEGVLKIENHNYRDSELQCPGSGDELT